MDKPTEVLGGRGVDKRDAVLNRLADGTSVISDVDDILAIRCSGSENWVSCLSEKEFLGRRFALLLLYADCLFFAESENDEEFVCSATDLREGAR